MIPLAITAIFSTDYTKEITLMALYEEQNAKKPGVEDDFDPSMHLIPLMSVAPFINVALTLGDEKPLTPRIHIPVTFGEDEKGTSTLVAVTTDGRISFFPTTIDELTRRIQARINERFPGGKTTTGQTVAQYVAVGVMYGEPGKGAHFILEVWGWLEPMGELDHLFSALNSLGGRRVGDKHWKAVEKELSSEPVRKWINALIQFLKQEIGWTAFVRACLDKALDTQQDL